MTSSLMCIYLRKMMTTLTCCCWGIWTTAWRHGPGQGQSPGQEKLFRGETFWLICKAVQLDECIRAVPFDAYDAQVAAEVARKQP